MLARFFALHSCPHRRSIAALWCAGLLLSQAALATPATLSLTDYIDRVLEESDRTRNLRDNLYVSQLGVELAKTAFSARVVPLASVNVNEELESQTLGLEVRRFYDYGTSVSAGVSSSKFSSDSLAINNPYNSKIYVRVSQSLFQRWGPRFNRHALTLADLEQRRQRLDAERAYQELILDAARRYYAALLSDLLVEQGELGFSRAVEHLEAAQSRYRVGLVSKADVYRAEIAQLDARSRIGDQRRSQQRDLEHMHELLALSGSNTVQPEAEVVRMTPLLPEQWEGQLLENRSDWHAHLLELDRARMNVYHASRRIDPDVNLSVVVEREGYGDDYEESSELDETNWTLLLDVRTTFEQYEERNALAQRRVSLNRIARDGERLKRSIFRGVRESFDEIQASSDRHQIAIERARQSELALELAALRYSKGMSSNLEMLDAESAFSAAQLDRLRSLVAYNIAVLNLGFNLGVLDPGWVAALFVPVEETSTDG